MSKTVDTSPADGNPTRYEYYVWDGDDVVMDFVDSDGAGTGANVTLAKRYLWGAAIDQILAEETAGGATVWDLADGLGTVRDQVDNTGNYIAGSHTEYSTFGYPITGTPSTRFLFTGQEFDPDTGLYYYNARWYDPATGRFMSVDPLGFAAGDANLMRYVGNSPTNYIDPTGLWDLMKWIYTGDGNASDDVYDAAKEAAGQSYSENAGLAHQALDGLAKVDPTRLARATNEVLTQLEGEELHRFVMAGGLPRNGGPHFVAPLQDECRAFMEYVRDEGPRVIKIAEAFDKAAEAGDDEPIGAGDNEDGAQPANGPGIGGGNDGGFVGGGNAGGPPNGMGAGAAPGGGINVAAGQANGPGADDAAAAGAVGGVLATRPPEEEGLQPYDVGTHGELSNKESTGDGLDKYHITSDASNRERFKLEHGREPLKSERDDLYRNSPAVASPHEKHKLSPTHGHKNTDELIYCDARDPVGAAQRDTDSFVEHADEEHRGAALKAQQELMKRAEKTRQDHEKRMRERWGERKWQ